MNDFQKKMKEKIKIYSNKQYLNGYIQNEFLTNDGDADIFYKLNSNEELFDTRTVHEQLDLVHTVYDFIEEKTSMLENHVKIHFHILGLSLSTKEQEKVRHLLKEHYAIELYKRQKEYIEYRNKIIGLLIFGFLCFVGYFILFFQTEVGFFSEVLGFFLSFSLWEAMDCYLYSFSEKKEEREGVTQNLLMDIDFHETDEIPHE